MRTALFVPLALVACTDTAETDAADTDTADTDTTDTGPFGEVIAAETDASGLTVELRAGRPLQTGLNEVWFRVTDDAGDPVDGLSLTQAPLMVMTDKEHACPYTQPIAVGDGQYAADVVFIMPSSEQDAWHDTVTIAGDATSEVTFADLDVPATGRVTMLTVGEERWVTSLWFPDEPARGENPFVFTVHRKQDMYVFPPVEGLDVVVEPFMPDMGHGSEGNVDPTYTRDGRYEGTVVFSMGGAWTVTFPLRQDGVEVASATFDVQL